MQKSPLQKSLNEFNDLFTGFSIFDVKRKDYICKAQLYWSIYDTVYIEQFKTTLMKDEKYIEQNIDYAKINNIYKAIFNNLHTDRYKINSKTIAKK
jgi:hypothetical protein